MKKLFTLLTLLVAIVTGAKAADEVVVIGSKSGGAFTITETTHEVAGYSGGTNSATLAAADDGQTASAGSKMGSTSNIGSKIVSGNKNHVRFTVAAGETVRFYYYQTSGANKSTTFATSRLDQSADYYHAPTEYIAAAKNSLYYVDFVFADAGSYAITSTTGQSVYMAALKFTAAATEAYTVTFNAGTNGTCTTTSLTEESAGAGITLPAATPNEGYAFDGWFTAATDGTKVGDAGETYHPTATVEIFAQYSQLAAPTISVTPTAPSTYLGVATTLTAEVTGAPNPTVTWYQNTAAATTGGTEVGTGLTYQPDVTTEGTFYYYAVAANDVEPSATSELVTLTVTDPNEYITGNSYYIETGDVKVGNAKVYGQDITMQYTGFTGSSSAAVEDNMLNGVNSNYVASVSHSSANGWGVEFTPTANGILKVGVIINKDKTFSITNVNSFSYVGKNGANPAEDIEGTINSGSYKTPNEAAGKMYVEVTINVVAGTKYKFSVASSKMGFYGFEFVPEGTTIPVTVTAAKYATFVPSQAVSFEGSGVKAFAAVYNEATGGATLNEVTAAPAGTPLVVNAEAGTYDLTVVATSETTAPAQNNLKVSDGTVEGDMQTIYGLKNGAQGVGFYPVTQNTTIAAGKVYLEIPAGEGAREFIGFGGEEVVTGIDAIENGTIDNDAPAYNLAGQKVGKGYKGIVIINGKKVVK